MALFISSISVVASLRGLTRRLLHTSVAAGSSTHPRITTHYSVVPRENNPRWEGKGVKIVYKDVISFTVLDRYN